jgi:hypothetical protein
MRIRAPNLIFSIAARLAGVGALSCGLADIPHNLYTPSAGPGPASAPVEVAHEEPPVAVASRSPAIHTGTVSPAMHPDRAPCAPFQESTNATCVTGFVGPMVVTDIEFGGDCADELIVLAVSVAAAGKVDVAHPHWYLENPARSRLSVHGAQFAVEATDELVFAARPLNGAAAAATGSACFITWSSKGPASPESVYPLLE